MSLKIKVFFDFVCPFCYLAKFPFDDIIQGKDVEVEYLPYEVYPYPTPQGDPINNPENLKRWETILYPEIKKLGINMHLPKISPQPYTHMTFEGFHFAKEYKKEKEYIMAVFKEYYENEKDISDINILTQIAKNIGLNSNKFEDTLKNRTYKEIQINARNYAYESSKIEIVPTFIIGNTKISGMIKKEDLEKALKEELEK